MAKFISNSAILPTIRPGYVLTVAPNSGVRARKMADFDGSLLLTFTPGCSQRLAGPLTPVPVAAAYNHAFVIPFAVHRAAVLVDNRLPPRPVKTLSLGLRCDTERKASTSSGWAGATRNRPPFPLRTVTNGWAPART